MMTPKYNTLVLFYRFLLVWKIYLWIFTYERKYVDLYEIIRHCFFYWWNTNCVSRNLCIFYSETFHVYSNKKLYTNVPTYVPMKSKRNRTNNDISTPVQIYCTVRQHTILWGLKERFKSRTDFWMEIFILSYRTDQFLVDIP